MEMVALSVLVLGLIICAAAHTESKPRRKSKKTDQKSDSKQHADSFSRTSKERERAREEHYMRNFWNYDGSDQLDYDEEVYSNGK